MEAAAAAAAAICRFVNEYIKLIVSTVPSLVSCIHIFVRPRCVTVCSTVLYRCVDNFFLLRRRLLELSYILLDFFYQLVINGTSRENVACDLNAPSSDEISSRNISVMSNFL